VRRLDKIFFAVSIIVMISLTLGTVSISSAADQTASLPPRAVGDKWTYSVDYAQPIGMVGTLTMEITSTSSTVSSYECSEYTATGEGTISADGATGTWTINGKQYEVKTDQSTAKTETTLEATVTSSTGTQKSTETTETDYNPPLEFNKGFPISAGSSWTSITTQTVTTNDNLNGDATNDVSSKTTTSNYIVLRTEDTKVTAGEFQTFVIKTTTDDGTSSEIYYSPKAHIQVKELDYDDQGKLTVSMELLSYKVAVPQSSFPSNYAIIAVAAGLIFAGVALGVMFFVRRGRVSDTLSPKV
jgi:hypothetical protein